MATEYTPLITTVRVAPPRRHYKRNVLGRFCTVALSSTLVWFALAFVISVIVFPHGGIPRKHRDDDTDWSWPGWDRRNVTYEELRRVILETPSSSKIEEWSRYYTAGPHLTGKNYSQVGNIDAEINHSC